MKCDILGENLEFKFPEDMECCLKSSLACYEEAENLHVFFDPEDDKSMRIPQNLTQSLGNIYNETGAFYMNKAASKYNIYY